MIMMNTLDLNFRPHKTACDHCWLPVAHFHILVASGPSKLSLSSVLLCTTVLSFMSMTIDYFLSQVVVCSVLYFHEVICIIFYLVSIAQDETGFKCCLCILVKVSSVCFFRRWKCGDVVKWIQIVPAFFAVGKMNFELFLLTGHQQSLVWIWNSEAFESAPHWEGRNDVCCWKSRWNCQLADIRAQIYAQYIGWRHRRTGGELCTTFIVCSRLVSK